MCESACTSTLPFPRAPTHTRPRAGKHTRTHTRARIPIYTYTYTHARVRTHQHTRTDKEPYIYVCARAHTHTHTHTHTSTNTVNKRLLTNQRSHQTTDPAIFLEPTSHEDNLCVVLPQHSPKVVDRVRHGTLCSNVAISSIHILNRRKSKLED